MNPSARPAKLLALAVSEWLLVLPAAVLLLVFLHRDDRLDPALAQVGAVGSGGVGLVGQRGAGPGAGPSRPRRLMRTACISGMNCGQSPC